jgi:hypothetical protein
MLPQRTSQYVIVLSNLFLGFSRCAKDAPKQVPKTDVEVLKTAAVNEVLSIFDKAGSLAEVAPLMSVAKKMNNCVLKCAEKKTNNCYKAMKYAMENTSLSNAIH